MSNCILTNKFAKNWIEKSAVPGGGVSSCEDESARAQVDYNKPLATMTMAREGHDSTRPTFLNTAPPPSLLAACTSPTQNLNGMVHPTFDLVLYKITFSAPS